MLAERLWEANADLAKACLEHPFVQGLADGSLSADAFRIYVGQDAFFLRAFRRAYALALAKATQDQIAATLYRLLGGVFEELDLHARYAESLGIDLHTVDPLPETRGYTDFIEALAWQRPVGETIAGMAPCMRLYAFLGNELVQRPDRSERYADWINTYASDDFQQLAHQMERLLASVASETPAVSRAYRDAMQFELAFFNAPIEQVS
jgi:thiaminase/transcriptional activator TenA